MTRFVAGLIGLLAIGWSGMAFAQASMIPTACPTNFTCAFTAAETLAFGVAQAVGSPGQPDVYVGYMEFDGSGNFTMTVTKNSNGTISQTSYNSGNTCTSGSSGLPAVITLSDKTQLSYVLDSPTAPTLLQFILTNDASTKSTANSVRVGVCHKLL